MHYYMLPALLVLLLLATRIISATPRWTLISGNNSIPNYGTKGVQSSLNMPPAMTSNQFGMNVVNRTLWVGVSANSLWRFHMAANEWTWMAGSAVASIGIYGNFGTEGVSSQSINPGSLSGAALAVSSVDGNVYLFGGCIGAYSCSLSYNTMWRFSSVNGTWTWIQGSTTNSNDQAGLVIPPGPGILVSR